MADDSETWIDEVATNLLAGGARSLSLDEVGDALGDRAVGADEVEKLLQRLESHGARIDNFVSEGLAPLLKQVISFARELREQGHNPSPSLIAKTSGLTVREVRVALLYFDVIKLG